MSTCIEKKCAVSGRQLARRGSFVVDVGYSSQISTIVVGHRSVSHIDDHTCDGWVYPATGIDEGSNTYEILVKSSTNIERQTVEAVVVDIATNESHVIRTTTAT